MGISISDTPAEVIRDELQTEIQNEINALRDEINNVAPGIRTTSLPVIEVEPGDSIETVIQIISGDIEIKQVGIQNINQNDPSDCVAQVGRYPNDVIEAQTGDQVENFNVTIDNLITPVGLFLRINNTGGSVESCTAFMKYRVVDGQF